MQVLAGVVRDLEMIGGVEDGEEPPDGPGSLDALVREFERLMSGMRPKADGVFLDAGVLRAYYRTCFYSALAILGEHMRESLSSSPDTRAFASDLGRGDEGVAGEFQRWYTNLANAKLGRPEIPALRKDLQTMPHFGAPLLLRTFLAIEEHSPYGDVGLRAAARRIAKRFDTRPRHLTAFADIVRRHVLDQERAEDLFERGIAALGTRERRLLAWWAGYRQDRDSLESLLDTPGLEPGEQADILEELAAVPGADSNAVEAGFRRCIASNRDSWELVDAYTGLLRSRGRWELARGALERWLDRDVPDAGPFEEIFARTRLARTYEDQGRYARAIEAIEPVVESRQFGAMDCMVGLLEKTGRLARAETLAVLAWGRYPDSPAAQARVIGLCWRQRKHDLAARMLAKAPVPLRAYDVRTELAPYFVDCFRASPAEGIRAVEAILASGYAAGDHLAQIAAALGEAGAPRLAFEVQSRMPAEGSTAIGRIDLCYRYRKRWKGEQEALEWVRPRLREMTPGDRGLLECIAYESGDYELLWEIEDVGPGPSANDFHWLLRAAASARMGAARDPRRAGLERHFARGGGEHCKVLGRFLLGREDEPAVLACATDPRSTCEALYYLGLRAQCEGRVREASRWYVRCVETGQFYNGEYRWAYDQLQRWAARGVSLARLEAEARDPAPPLAGATE
jgi:tetratricopeptide (TPR) repeat protein